MTVQQSIFFHEYIIPPLIADLISKQTSLINITHQSDLKSFFLHVKHWELLECGLSAIGTWSDGHHNVECELTE